MNQFKIDGVRPVSPSNLNKDRKPVKVKKGEEEKKIFDEEDTVEFSGKLSEELEELLKRAEEK